MHKILRAESRPAVTRGHDYQGSPSLACQVLPKVSLLNDPLLSGARLARFAAALLLIAFALSFIPVAEASEWEGVCWSPHADYFEERSGHLNFTYSGLNVTFVNAVYYIGKPAYLTISKIEDIAFDAVMGLGGGPSGVVAAVIIGQGIDVGMALLGNMVETPQVMAAEIGGRTMEKGILALNENFDVYRNGVSALDDAAKLEFRQNQVYVDLMGPAKTLFLAATEDESVSSVDPAIVNALSGLETILTQTPLIGGAAKLLEVASIIRQSGIGIESYGPYRDYLRELAAVREANEIITCVTAANRPPVFVPVGSQRAESGGRLRFAVVATDPDEDPVTVRAEMLPSGASFDGREFAWIVPASFSGERVVRFIASDDDPTSADAEMTVRIVIVVRGAPVSPGTITTVAGTGEYGFSGDGGPASEAQLYSPRGVAVDGAGNLYIADRENNRIRRVDSTGTITTVAGTGLDSPSGVAVDGAGNLYIADTLNHSIRKVDSTGTITTVAGTRGRGFWGDGGPATEAPLNLPGGMAVDSAGNLYIADSGNFRIRKIDSTGTITTVAGSVGPPGFSGDGGPATAARLDNPHDVAVDGAGNLYIADNGNNRIRKVDSTGTITTIAGTSELGYSGDGGLAIAAQFSVPTAVAVDGAGNLYIVDTWNHRIRKVDLTGTITTVAGTGGIGVGGGGYSGDGGPAVEAQFSIPTGVAVDGAGNLYIADAGNQRIRKVTPVGSLTPPNPTVPATPVPALALASFGRFHVIAHELSEAQDHDAECRSQLGGGFRLADWNDIVAYYESGGSLTDFTAGLRMPVDTGEIADGYRISRNGEPLWGGTRHYYVARHDHQRRPSGFLAHANIDNYHLTLGSWFGTGGHALCYGESAEPDTPTGWTITTIAGTGEYGFSGDGGPASEAQLYSPRGVAVDGAGNLYIADWRNHRIRKVDSTGTITTVAGTGVPGFSGDGGPATAARLHHPNNVAVDSAGNVYISDDYSQRIRKVDSTGTITTVAGTGYNSFSGDGGPAVEAYLQGPRGVAVDGSGNLYIADSANDRIRKVDSTGTITTIAGTGERGFSGDGGPAVEAQLNGPYGVAVDGSGNLYIADPFNSRIRKVDSTGTITTVAGTGVQRFSGDGGPAAAAQLVHPYGVAVDGSGNLYIADYRIRKVDSTGIITMIAGSRRGSGFSGDGGPASEAQLASPRGLAVDSAGNLYISDTGNNRIRKLTPMTGPAAPVPVIPGGSEWFSISAVTPYSLTVEWKELENTGSAITDYDVRYREVGSGGDFTDAQHTGTARTATLTGLSPGTAYEVQVRASNDTGTGAWSQLGVVRTSPQQTGDQIYYFPHLAAGASWQTTITYINYSSEVVSCTTEFLSDQGSPLLVSFADRGTVVSRIDVLPPGGSVHQETNVGLTLAPGWARASCTGPLKASLLFRQYNSAGAPVAEAAVNATRVAATRFVTFAEQGEGKAGTGVAYANPSATAALVTFTAKGAEGRVLARVDRTLLPGGHEAQNMASLFGLPSFSGSLEMTSTEPIVSLSLNFEAAPVFSSLPPGEVDAAAQGATTYYFPHLAAGAGWQTTITYINYSSQQVSCTTEFLSDHGSPLLVSFADRGTVISRRDVLPAGGTVHQETNVGLTLAPGWARASCTGPLKASLLFRQYNSAGETVAEAAVNATRVAATRFVTFAEQGEGKFGTGVAYANPSATAALVTFTAKGAAGQVLARVDRTLLPGGHEAQNMASLFGLPSFSGSLEMTSTEPIVSLSLNFEEAPVFSSLPPGEVDTAPDVPGMIPMTGAPDLVVQIPFAPLSDSAPAAGANFILAVTVRNVGDAEASATTLRYYRSNEPTISSGDTPVGTDAMSALAASGASAESIRLTAPASAGIYYYGACVDAVSGESRTGNNCSQSVRVTVSGGGSGAGKMYWTDWWTGHKIQRANLDGSGVEDLVTSTSGLVWPHGLALDLGAGKMYWTDWWTNKIQRANLNGSGVEDLVTSGLGRTGSLALDLGAGKMYWTDWGTDKIQRANLDGSGVEDLVTSGLNRPTDLALDPGAGKMYWTDEESTKIQRANLDGSGVEDLVTSGLFIPTGLALDPGAGKMYWTDDGTDKIQRANLDGSGVEDLLTSGFDTIGSLALDTSGAAGGGGSSLPDLVLETPSVSVSTLRTAQSFDFRVTVRNQGGLRSVATTLRYYRSNEPTISSSDTPVGTDAVRALVASGASAESIRLTAPASAGIYYYGACADPVSGESRTGNNCSLSVRVTVSGDGSGTGKMYWTDAWTNKIQRANQDGSGVEDLLTSGLSRPRDLELDLGAGKMYWTDAATDKIQRANLDGSGVEDLLTSGLLGPSGLALDLGAGKMYWTDEESTKIQRANLDGSGVEDLLTSGLFGPTDLALDLGAGKMYWTDLGPNKIQRANLNGSGVEDLLTSTSGLRFPSALALDLGAGKMYWTDAETGKIQRANLDGSGVEDLLTSGLSDPRGLALDTSGVAGGGGATARSNKPGGVRQPLRREGPGLRHPYGEPPRRTGRVSYSIPLLRTC